MPKTPRLWIVASLLAISVVTTLPLRAHAALGEENDLLAYSQQAIGRRVTDGRFTNMGGADMRLAALRGRPVVLNFIYTSCGDVCPLIIETVAHAVDQADAALGPNRFAVVTVGFDTNFDTPNRMRDFAHAHAISRPDWLFLSGELDTVARLAAEAGFLFAPRAGGFDHLAQTTILDKDGRVYRQIYGNDFALPALVEPLKDLVFSRPRQDDLIFSLINRVRLLCTIYDPAAGRYRFSYAIFIGIFIGAASLMAVAIALVRMWRQNRIAMGNEASV